MLNLNIFKICRTNRQFLTRFSVEDYSAGRNEKRFFQQVPTRSQRLKGVESGYRLDGQAQKYGMEGSSVWNKEQPRRVKNQPN